MICVVLGLPITGFAQYRPTGEQYREVSAVLRDIGAKSHVYLPASKSDRQLFFQPFFAMKADRDRKLKVTVSKGSKAAKKVISVWILISPQNKVDAIASYIRSQEAINPRDERFAKLQSSDLIGIPFINLEVSERGSKVGFSPVKLESHAAQGELQLDAEVSADKADEIAEGIRLKSIRPIFRIQYELNARIQLSQSQIQADTRFFHETKAVKDLLGAASAAEKFGWKIHTTGTQFSQPFLTRDQKSTFEGRLRNQVVMLIQLEDDRDSQFVQFMQNYLSKVLKMTTLDLDKTSLGKELSRLSAYDFDPKDLRPDQIDQLVLDVKNFFSKENADEHMFKAGASASYLGIGGSASTEISGKELRKSMQDKGWKFSVNGKISIPRALEVHLINNTALKTEGVYSLTVERNRKGFIRLEHQISTESPLFDRSPGDVVVTVEELRAEVARLRTNLKQLEDAGIENQFHKLVESKIRCVTIKKLVVPPELTGKGDFVGDGSAKEYVFSLPNPNARVLGAWIPVGSFEPDEQRIFLVGSNYIGARPAGRNRVAFTCPVGKGGPKVSVPITVLYLEQ
jgi:hypothetical protein